MINTGTIYTVEIRRNTEADWEFWAFTSRWPEVVELMSTNRSLGWQKYRWSSDAR